MNHHHIVLTALKKGAITQQDMIGHGVFRLSARILELREQGFPIEKQMEQGVNQYGNPVRYARYCLK